MDIALTASDIVFAAILAFVITWVIQGFSKIFRFVPSEFDYSSAEIANIMQKCCSFFPKEILQFKGKTLKRGMIVRVTTLQQKVFEGKLIGYNKDNVVCVLTSKYVIAHELDNIQDIAVVKGEE